MPKRIPDAYIKLSFRYEDYDAELLESVVVLPGVLEAAQMYPDDPALYNVALVRTSPDDAAGLLETLANYDYVEYAEIIDEPEVRGKMS